MPQLYRRCAPRLRPGGIGFRDPRLIASAGEPELWSFVSIILDPRGRIPESSVRRRVGSGLPAVWMCLSANGYRAGSERLEKQFLGSYIRGHGEGQGVIGERPLIRPMPKVYSDDLRAKSLEAYAAGRGTLEELALSLIRMQQL